MLKGLLVFAIFCLISCQDVSQYKEILHNIQKTRLGLCGCEIATTQDQCFGPCIWKNAACGTDPKFLSTKDEDDGQKAESSGDLKLTNDCTNYFDEESCLAQRYHDGLFCTWEESECVKTDCKQFGVEECMFIYFCQTKDGECTRCAGNTYGSIIVAGLALSILMYL